MNIYQYLSISKKYLSTQSSVMAMETDRHFSRETQRSKLNASAVDHSLVDYQ